VVDGHFLPATPNEIFAQGKQNDVPELTGCNKDDLGGGVPHPDTTPDAFEKMAKERYGDMGAAFLKLYPAGFHYQTSLGCRRTTRLATNCVRRCTCGRKIAPRPRRPKSTLTTGITTLPGPDADKYGAFHTSEVPYVFNSLAKSDRPFTDADRHIAEMMSSYWANFAATGDPNGKGLPHWPSLSDKPAMTMELGDNNTLINIAGSQAKLEFFTKYFSTPQARP